MSAPCMKSLVSAARVPESPLIQGISPSSLLPVSFLSFLPLSLPLNLSISTSPSMPSILLPSLQSRVRKLTETNEEVPELKQRLRVLEEKQQTDETRTRELEVR